MGYRARSILLGATAFATQPAFAMELDWVRGPQEMSALSSLAAGYAGGLRCDRLVDAAVAGKFLDAAFGGRKFSADEVAQIAKVLIGIQAAQGTILGRPSRKGCEEVRKSFGPSGTVVRGLLD